MGSWNACCGISKLPIQFGDPVVDFFIGDVGRFRDSGFICYSNDLWAPLTIQTYGVYDDYGQIREEAGWHSDYVVKVLKTHLVELEQGENKYHDIAIKRDDMTFELAQEAVHEGRLYLHAIVDQARWRYPFNPYDGSSVCFRGHGIVGIR